MTWTGKINISPNRYCLLTHNVVFETLSTSYSTFVQSQKGTGPDFVFTCVNVNILTKVAYLQASKYFSYLVRVCV